MRGAFLASLAGLSVVFAAGAVAHSFSAFDAQRQAFSRETWHELKPLMEQTADPGCILGPMTQDLIQSGQLLGTTATKALQLLGAPSSQSASGLVYAIGQCHGWGWYHSELVLAVSPQSAITGLSVRKVE
jgi:hypothetical protein